MRRLTPVAALLLAACVAPTPAPMRAPAPGPAMPPAPVPPAAWQDGPATPGNWRWERDARGSAASFGGVDGPALFVVRCDLPARTVSLAVPASAAPGAMLTVQTSDEARSFPPGATVAASDGFLDRIAFSRGRFRVQPTGGAALVIPAWPEVARTIEECRG